MKQLIALAVIAAATLAADQAELQPGTTFEAPDDVADKLVTDWIWITAIGGLICSGR